VRIIALHGSERTIHHKESRMIQLKDQDTGAVVGEITEGQLQFLVDQLEEEDAKDKDYWLNRDALELLGENGADPELLTLLRTAMGSRDEMTIVWS